METIFHLCVIAAVGSGLIAMSHHDNVKYQAAEEQRQIEYKQKQAEESKRIAEHNRKINHYQICSNAGQTYVNLIEYTMKFHDVTAPNAVQILQKKSIIDPTCDTTLVLKRAYTSTPWLDCLQPSAPKTCWSGAPSGTKAVFVEGHNRNGTWVGPHIRTWPDGNPNNNLSR